MESQLANLDSVNEDDTLSDRASLSSIENMIESYPEPDESSFQQNTGFSQSQHSALKTTTQNLFTNGMTSPLGLSRPTNETWEDKILRGEYINLALLLSDTLYQSQTPEIQLCLNDSSSGPWVLQLPRPERKKQ